MYGKYAATGCRFTWRGPRDDIGQRIGRCVGRKTAGAAARVERRRLAATRDRYRGVNRLNRHRIFNAVRHIHQTWG